MLCGRCGQRGHCVDLRSSLLSLGNALLGHYSRLIAAFILLFCIGKLVLAKADVTWLLLLIVYGVDGCLTIVHRIMLHEPLGEAHRKHAYQLMANELKMNHVTVSLLYMGLQLAVNLGFIYLCPDSVLAHWIYGLGVLAVLSLVYVC